MLLYTPAEINTFNLGNFLDGHAQVKPGIDPLGLFVRQIHHRSIELIAELLILQDFFRGRWGGGMIYQIPAGTGFEMCRIPHRKTPGAGQQAAPAFSRYIIDPTFSFLGS